MAVSRRKALGIFGGGAVLAAAANGTTDIPKADKPDSVAIVGGGISGLSVAYYLVRFGFKGEITVVEKSPTLGGNAATAEVVLGTDFRGGGLLKEFVRFADLGVNDVNLNSYKRLKHAMNTIGYSTEVTAGNLLPLEDTAAFFTPDLSDSVSEPAEVWTKDGYLSGQAQPYTNAIIDDRRGVVDASHSLHVKDPELAQAEQKFMEMAAADFDPKLGTSVEMHPPWWDYTVDEYVEHYRTQHVSEKLDDVVGLFLYPRISAMYFADERGAGYMPMRGVMSYYRLQEGVDESDEDIDDGGIDRRYFAKGSQHWISVLAEWLKKKGVNIYTEFEAVVSGVDENRRDRVKVDNVLKPSATVNQNPKSFVVDQIVMAGHADNQLQSFKDDTLLSKKMEKILKDIKHSTSYAYAHTWSRLLPPNPGQWRTYNVMIRPQLFGSKFPYQMTYVQNRHRNDRHNKDYNEYGLPVYFVSLNPQSEIPPEYILKRTEKDARAALKKPAGYNHNPEGNEEKAQQATATFRHTVMTSRLLEIQEELPDHQGLPDRRVFFAGCWSNGAGLHEECFEQAKRVVNAMGFFGKDLG